MADVSFLSDESAACSIPTIAPQTLSAARFLQPDILIHIFKYLPIAATRNVALCSRRFKVLVYDDEIWDEKLRCLGIETPVTVTTQADNAKGGLPGRRDSAPHLPLIFGKRLKQAFLNIFQQQTLQHSH